MDCDIFRKIPPTLSCCFCSSSKTGARIIGVLELAVGALFILFLMSGIQRYFIQEVFIGIYASLIIFNGTIILIGVNKEKLILVRIWLFAQVLFIVFSFVGSMVVISYLDYYREADRDFHVVLLVIIEVIQVYCVVVVGSHYSKKAREATSTGSRPDDSVVNA